MPVVVMVTAHDDFAVEAYEHQAIDYLLKPWSDERLERAIANALNRLALQTAAERARAMSAALVTAAVPAQPQRWPERILVRGDESSYFVTVASIDWIEASSNHVLLHVGADTHRVRLSLRALLEQLDPARFVRIHRSTAVQVDRIKEIQPWFTSDYLAVLRDGRTLRVSRVFRDELLRQFR
jgi:two-component system LytT family response regulator